jgi:putative selenium metabolism protein SsnA
MNATQPILVKNGIVMTFGKDNRVIPGGAVLIADGKVLAVGPEAEVAPLAAGLANLKVVDAKGCAVTPGLIIAHMHLYSTLSCGISCAVSHNFGEILENLWWRLDKAMNMDDVRLSAVTPAIRCLKAGVTTIIDHHASYGAITGSLAAVSEECRRVGLRAAMAYEVSDRLGPDACREAIDENASFIRAAAEANDPDVAALFGLHASFTLSEATLKACVEAANGAGFHVHCAEDMADVLHARAAGFEGAADRLVKLGIAGDKSIFGHCIHVTPGEVAAIKATGTTIVTNPQSNMNNAVGVANVPNLLASGCTVGLGSDGMTSNIFEELRAEIFTQRQRTGDCTQMFCEAVDMVLSTNPAIASRVFGRPVGVLAPGAAGDVVVWDYDPVTPLSGDNAYGHMVFGLPNARAKTVVVSGRVTVEDYRLPGIDEAAIAAESRALAASLWKRW